MHNWASGYGGTLNSPREDLARRVEAIKFLSLKRKLKTILDFGSGEGEMIDVLATEFNVRGLEPEDDARARCLKKGRQVFASTDEALSAKDSYDAVTLFHVIEHFYDPFSELKKIQDLLNPGGYLIIETPNSQDALLAKYKSAEFANFTYWSHHPMLHSMRSLTALTENSGFEKVEYRGIQRYGLSNHLYWLAEGKPGGHTLWEKIFSAGTESSYSNDLMKEGLTDTLWVVAQKPIL